MGGGGGGGGGKNEKKEEKEKKKKRDKERKEGRKRVKQPPQQPKQHQQQQQYNIPFKSALTSILQHVYHYMPVLVAILNETFYQTTFPSQTGLHGWGTVPRLLCQTNEANTPLPWSTVPAEQF